MISDLKPYPETKDSGVKWLGEVPTHWDVRRLGHIGALLKGHGGSKADEVDEGVPCVRYGDLYTTHTWVITETRSSVTQEKAGKYTPIRLGDVLFAASGETVDEIGKSAVNLISSRACCGGDIILFRSRLQLDPRFMGYAADCRAAVTQKARMGRGFTVVHIYPHQIKRVALAIPPLSEQSAIARFLDHATDRIERYICAKEKLIALLEEQKQVLIHDAVTGRIDVRTGKRYPAYKRSGVTWVDELPEHWKVQRLGHIGRFSKGYGGTKADEIDNGVPCVRYGDIYTQHRFFVHSSRACVAPDLAATTYSQIKCGDVLFAASGETIDEIGKSAVNLIDGPACCGGDVIILRPSTEIDPRFLGYAADSPAAVSQKARMGRGFTVMHIYSGALKRLTVPVPPAPEQIAIARFLDGMIVGIDSVVERSHRQINLMSELRTRLIADIVTGKRDVREAAGALPEKTRSLCTALNEVESGDANQEEATKMTNWDTCPAVERKPGKVSGAWVFAGTRIPLSALYENLAGGATVDEFVEWFPGVDEQQVRTVLEHEAQTLRAELVR